MRSFFIVTEPLLPGCLGVVDVYVREKKRESVDIANCNYRHHIGENFGLDKTF